MIGDYADVPEHYNGDSRGIVVQKIVGPITQKSLDAGIQALVR